jgi:SAM-dependent methyltransferase
MKKFLYNFFLLIKNFKKYGIKNITFIIFFEFLHSLRLLDIKTSFYEKGTIITNKRKKNVKMYNAAYSPTPYYFLHLINIFLKEKKIDLKKYYLVDFGCGYGRLLNFFENKTKKFLGIDINKKYINFLKKKYKSQNFINADLRNYKSIVKKIKILTKNNKKILYFYEPFEDILVYKIIKTCLKPGDICIVVNIKNFKVLRTFRSIYTKFLGDKMKNILIIKLPK